MNAIRTQNLTLPSGLQKIGETQYTVRTNAMPTAIADLNDIPIKYVNGRTVFIRDVGQVQRRLGGAAEHGSRERRAPSCSVYVIKNGDVSTVAVVDGVRKAL